jgi:glycosyltransferase involved in cell wall biosynthesis
MTSRERRLAALMPLELEPSEQSDSVVRTNADIGRMLARRYPLVPLADAELCVAGELTPEPITGPPRLIFAHGALGDPGHWLLTLPRVRVCDALALTSSSDRAIFDTLAGPRRCQTVWLPLFVDTTAFAPRPEVRPRVRARWNVPDNAPLLLTASALAAQKNVQSALMLLKELQRTHPDAHCLIAGDGSSERRAYLEDLAQRLGVMRSVRFVGQQSQRELCELYNAADLFVHLTLNRKENFGLVSVEAQACGLPVLAGRWGGVRDTLVHGETGFFADSYLIAGEWRVDWLTLLPHAQRLLDEPALRAQFARQARAFAVRRHSRGAFGSRLYRFLDRWPTQLDSRTLQLSAAGNELAVAFAARAVAHPELDDSRSLSETLRTPYQGGYAYRAIHECMASSAPPEEWRASSIAYRMVDADIVHGPHADEPARSPELQLEAAQIVQGSSARVLDPAWRAERPLDRVQLWLWQALACPCGQGELRTAAARSGIDEPAFSAAWRGLVHAGLIGSSARPVT